jgi:hypothetical protein
MIGDSSLELEDKRESCSVKRGKTISPTKRLCGALFQLEKGGFYLCGFVKKKGATKSNEEGLVVFTVGHSSRTADEFISLLRAHHVRRVADIRTIPKSRRNPQFGEVILKASLESAGIKYIQLAGLGGLRRAKKDSINTGWRNTSFRGYADYMQTSEFGASLQTLIELAEAAQVAIMCAEAVPWRCHRSLVADALIARGIRVEHIMTETNRYAHSLTPFAEVTPKGIIYPPEKAAA